MKRLLELGIVVLVAGTLFGQQAKTCSCGSNPPGRPLKRTMKPYAQEPEELRPFSKFTTPYYEHYTDLVEYNGAARDVPDPDPSTLDEIRIGFLGPLRDNPEEPLGRRMLNGAQLAIEDANVAGGYCGKPFRLMLHNDAAIWGASSNEVVKMVYDDRVWAMFGSISGDTTHIALRVALRSEVPLVNSASTDPTIPETIIPWYFTDIQDDRVQGYTLARHIYTEVGLKRVALLRVNSRYGRFGVAKFRDASRRLGHPIVIEQKFLPGDTDFRRQLKVIAESRPDGIVLWADQKEAALVLHQMKQLGLRQRVFGSHRTIGDEFLKLAGAQAEGFEAIFPYDPTHKDAKWSEFQNRFASRYQEKPDHFAALAYDAMKVLLDAICKAGLNRGRIRDALTGVQSYQGVTGEMVFDPNCKNISPMYLATVRNGRIEYRRATMERAYARIGEEKITFNGPEDSDTQSSTIIIFGPDAESIVRSPEFSAFHDKEALTIVAVGSRASWGKSVSALVEALGDRHSLAVIALDRDSAHLAEQIGTKLFVPVLAISSDKMLTSTNIPWIFRLSAQTTVLEATKVLSAAVRKAGMNRQAVRALLASGEPIRGMRFQSSGEPY
jgi:ABC-type branched-subunit amino acid transport system substrate-binding protein